jgi:Ribbon-helix-helix protein, copG family
MRFLGDLRSVCGPKSRDVPWGGSKARLVGPRWRFLGGLVKSRDPRDALVDYGRSTVVKTTIYLPDELHQRIKQAAKERGTSEAEVIRTAIHHELPGALVNQQERAYRRARLLAAVGNLDSSVYPAGYLDEIRVDWRS